MKLMYWLGLFLIYVGVGVVWYEAWRMGKLRRQVDARIDMLPSKSGYCKLCGKAEYAEFLEHPLFPEFLGMCLSCLLNAEFAKLYSERAPARRDN